MLGILTRSGIGSPVDVEGSKPTTRLKSEMRTWNKSLLQELREDHLAEKLMQLTIEDARLGRMTWPKPVDEICLDECFMSPRFAVEQIKPDGRTKVRAVDNFSWAALEGGTKVERKACSVNGESCSQPLACLFHITFFSLPGHVAASEKLKHEAMDEICHAMRLFWNLTGHSPGLWKADIDAAFRRVPLNPQQRWSCGVAFVLRGKVCPFRCEGLR